MKCGCFQDFHWDARDDNTKINEFEKIDHEERRDRNMKRRGDIS